MIATAPSERRPPLWWVLARHEWRLTFRDFLGGSRERGATNGGTRMGTRAPVGRQRLLLGCAAAIVLLHAGGALVLFLPHRWHDTQVTRLGAIGLLLFLFTLMLSSAMSRIVAAFHERRDLDLLLGAPIPPTLILVIRVTTVVAAVSALFAVFVYPLADVGVATGRWYLARLYPLVPLMAMTATAVALVMTGAFVRLVGVRRARVGLQVFSALVGASFYLVSQSRQFLPTGLVDDAMRRLMAATRDGDGAWPVRVAARLAGGDGPTWFAFAGVATALLVVAVRLARSRFVEVARTPEADAPVVARDRSAIARRIRSSFHRRLFVALLVKEWRLILRSPQLISQILLQLLYLMPLMFVAIGHGGSGLRWGAAAFAAGIVGLAGTLTASLAWLTVSAEDAPDLLAGSPKSRATILSSKLVAAAGPPIAILLLAALGTLQRSAMQAVVVVAFGTLACLGAAILEAATPSPGKRSDFQRRQKGRGLWALLDGLQFLLWAGAAGLAASGWWIAAAGVALVACIAPGLRLPRALASASRPPS